MKYTIIVYVQETLKLTKDSFQQGAYTAEPSRRYAISLRLIASALHRSIISECSAVYFRGYMGRNISQNEKNYFKTRKGS